MAVVSIKWSKDASAYLKYVQRERGEDDITSSSDCSVENAQSDFENVRKEHRNEKGNQTLHIVQSFSPEDSQNSTPEQLHAVGISLAEENFKGHQFVIRTHTDKAHFHNHIVVNTVNAETGKKIENKRSLIQKLRDSSDKLCAENGLSVINRDANERAARLPFKVQQMIRRGGKSYIFDLVQKADVARSIASSFDEYRDILQSFKIRAVIEEKNISYFYPGHDKAKRGSKLGKNYDKAGLIEAFKSNDEKYAKRPELKSLFLKHADTIAKHGMPPAPGDAGKFTNPWSGKDHPFKDHTQYTKIERRKSEKSFHSDRELKRISVPASEIRKAREASILVYCDRNKIALTKNQNGETVIKGREFVSVTDFEFKNNKNGTSGSLIDLVAVHRNMTLLQATAHITGNEKLLLLEEHMGEAKRKYTSFYIPRPDRPDWKTGVAQVSRFLSSNGASPSLAPHLLSNKMAQTNKGGLIRLLAKDGATAALEFFEKPPGQWKKRNHGKSTTPFYSERGSSRKTLLFTDPFSLFRHVGESLFSGKKRDVGLLGLLDGSDTVVHHFVAEHPRVDTLYFVPSHSSGMSKVELDLFNNLKFKLKNFGIGIESVTHERMHDIALGKEEREFGLSL